eukprot:GDKH01014539.1.p2 GENE.GDKH01014539.1~~GDKH01014539.1.p2  ORF type:complete len:72 (-),score=14.79 GDKH01014539.1:95-310(-)
MRGVFFDDASKCWCACYHQAGTRMYKMFDVTKMGFDQAYKAAIAVRKQKLEDEHRFQPQRWRRRYGRLAFN